MHSLSRPPSLSRQPSTNCIVFRPGEHRVLRRWGYSEEDKFHLLQFLQGQYFETENDLFHQFLEVEMAFNKEGGEKYEWKDTETKEVFRFLQFDNQKPAITNLPEEEAKSMIAKLRKNVERLMTIYKH